MTCDLSVIWVHYHTPDLLRESLSCVDRELAAEGLSGELVVIDNGSRPGDRESFAELPLQWVDAGSNLGYAGAVNLGVARTRADQLLVLNPDVMLLPGCVGALRDALRQFWVVAPNLSMDHAQVLRLPPTERRDLVSRVLDLLVDLGPWWAGLARRRWRKHARRYWSSSRPYPGYELSGAALAFRRELFERVGPWDDRYQLFFEETDWLHRVRRHGLPAAFVPAARAQHLYAQSSQREPRTAEWFAASESRFEELHVPPWQRRLLAGIARRVAPWQHELHPAPFGDIPSGAAFLELSPLPRGYPAAAGELTRSQDWQPVVDDVRAQLPAGGYYLRWTDARGRELALRTLEIGAG